MTQESTRQRMIYLSAFLVILVILILEFFAIPHIKADTTPGATPGRAVPALQAIIIIHLLIVWVFPWTHVQWENNKPANRALLTVSGMALILISFLLLDGAIAYLVHPALYTTAAAMFTCIAFDLTSGILTLVTRFSNQSYTDYTQLPPDNAQANG